MCKNNYIFQFSTVEDIQPFLNSSIVVSQLQDEIRNAMSNFIACSLHVLDVCTRGNKDFVFRISNLHWFYNHPLEPPTRWKATMHNGCSWWVAHGNAAMSNFIACSLHVLDVCTRGNKDFVFRISSCNWLTKVALQWLAGFKHLACFTIAVINLLKPRNNLVSHYTHFIQHVQNS